MYFLKLQSCKCVTMVKCMYVLKKIPVCAGTNEGNKFEYTNNFRETLNRLASPRGTLLVLMKYGLSEMSLFGCVYLAARTKPGGAQ